MPAYHWPQAATEGVLDMTDTRFWGGVGALFALHATATFAAITARIGIYWLTIPIVGPLIGGESVAGRLLVLFLADAGILAALALIARVALKPRTDTGPGAQEVEGGTGPGPVTAMGRFGQDPKRRSPQDHLTRAGHLMVAGALMAAGLALAFARDRIFVVAAMQPAASGTFTTLVRPVFADQFAGYLPWVLFGGSLDIAHQLVFATTSSPAARLAARGVARTGTAAVLLLLSTGSIFNIPGSTESLVDTTPLLALLANALLFALAVAALAGGAKDWLRLARLPRGSEEAPQVSPVESSGDEGHA
jgi:hypothetical protein